jgi:hypothetical protein
VSEKLEGFSSELVKGGKVAVPGDFDVEEPPQTFNEV